MFYELHRTITLWRIWLLATCLSQILVYRRTYLGTGWLAINVTLIVLVKALLFTGILSVPDDRLIPNLAFGMLMWRLISGHVNTCSHAFPRNNWLFEQGHVPLMVPTFASIARHIFTLLHGIVPIVLISAFYVLPEPSRIPIAILGFLMFIATAISVGFIVSVVCTRFRDLPSAISSAMGVAFFLTPIVWVPEMLEPSKRIFLLLNPFYHFIEIVRDPLIGQPTELINWWVCSGILLFSWFVSWAIYTTLGRRVLVWI